MKIQAGQSVLLSTETSGVCLQLCIENGYARLSDSELTLAFVGSGDLQRARIPAGCAGCLEALTDLSICWQDSGGRESDGDLVGDWMAELLKLRAYGQADRRLMKLFQILLTRYGYRLAHGYWLPFALSHHRLAELIGSTRSTATRAMLQMRERFELIDPAMLGENHQPGLVFQAEFLDGCR